MFKNHIGLQKMNEMSVNTIGGQIGIEFLEVGDNYIIAKMPVDNRTRQPFGILHGGASVVLAETLGSIASWMCLENPKDQKSVGLEINANHIRSVSEGWVFGKVTPVHVGRKTQIWEINITDEQNKLVCISRLTVMTV